MTATAPNPEESGPPEAPFTRNPVVSNEQAAWLTDQRRCWFCYKTNAECRAERKHVQRCNDKYTAKRIKTSEHSGCPKWNR